MNSHEIFGKPCPWWVLCTLLQKTTSHQFLTPETFDRPFFIEFSLIGLILCGIPESEYLIHYFTIFLFIIDLSLCQLCHLVCFASTDTHYILLPNTLSMFLFIIEVIWFRITSDGGRECKERPPTNAHYQNYVLGG